MSRHRGFALGYCTAFAIGLVIVPALCAQDRRRETGRQLVEGLLRVLIDSQLDQLPVQPPRPAPAQLPAELIEAREALGSFAQQSGGLVRQLNGRGAPTGYVRRLMGSALQVNASAARLAAYSRRVSAVADLQDGVRDLDREWRLLSHHLQQIDDLPADCGRAVRALDELDARLCTLCAITPQADYQQLAQVTAAIDTSLGQLIRDIEIELARTPQCARLMVQGGRVLQECRAFAAFVRRREPTETMVAQLEVFYPQWQSFSTNVNVVGNRFLERDVRRIDEQFVLLHELLWLPRPVDHARLQHLTKVLTGDVDRLFDSVSLNLLLELRGAQGVLETASEFYGLCENFSFAVESRAPLAEMRESYQYLVAGWPELARCFRYAKESEVVRALNAIEESFVTLQSALGIAPEVDWHAAAEKAAACDRLASQMNEYLRRYVSGSARYDRDFRRRAEEHMAALRQSTSRLNQDLVDRRNRSLQDHCARVADTWAGLNDECLNKLTANDKRYFARLQPQMTQNVVQLQAMLRL